MGFSVHNLWRQMAFYKRHELKRERPTLIAKTHHSLKKRK